ncbi:MAG: RNA polymerase sigma factor [Acidobacteriota bacterium]
MARPSPPDSADVRRAIERWRRGEDAESHFRTIAEAYYRRLHRFFAARGRGVDDAHDLTQETFVRIYTGLGGFKANSSFETWLFAVAANVLRQSRRGRTTLKRGAGMTVESLDERPRDPAVPGAGPLDRAIQRERTDALRRAADALPPKMRAVLKMHLYQGRDRRQIAEALGIAEETVKAHLHQAKKRLAETLRQSEEDGR